jgi:hypothetical protein
VAAATLRTSSPFGSAAPRIPGVSSDGTLSAGSLATEAECRHMRSGGAVWQRRHAHERSMTASGASDPLTAPVVPGDNRYVRRLACDALRATPCVRRLACDALRATRSGPRGDWKFGRLVTRYSEARPPNGAIHARMDGISAQRPANVLPRDQFSSRGSATGILRAGRAAFQSRRVGRVSRRGSRARPR